MAAGAVARPTKTPGPSDGMAVLYRITLVAALFRCVGRAAGQNGAVAAAQLAKPLPSPPIPSTVRTDDVRIDERAWLAAPILTDFTQSEPDEGLPSARRTEARIIAISPRAEALDFLPDQAYSAGLRFEHQWSKRMRRPQWIDCLAPRHRRATSPAAHSDRK